MKKLWMLLAGAAVVMSACSDDNTENVVPVPDDSLTTLSEISAVLPESRTYLDDHEFAVGASVKTLWSDGDCISVWSDEQPNPVLFRLEGPGGSANGTFHAVGESTVRGSKFYALYNGDQTNATKTVTLSGTQAQEGNGTCNIASGIAPMAAYTEGEYPNYAEAFNFKNLCGIMALTLTPDDDVRLAKLNFVGGNNLSGSGTVTFASDGTPSLVLNSSTSTSLTRDCSIDMTKDQSYTVYVVVPAGEYRYLSVDAYISSDPTKPVLSRRRQGTGNAAFTIKAGGITRVANFPVKTIAPHVYAVGDVYPYDATGDGIQGIVYEAAEDGLSGKIIYSKVLGPAVWASDAITGTSSYPSSTTNGETNMTVAKADIDNFPAFKLCVGLTPVSTKYNWYIPSRNEAEVLTTYASDINSAARLHLGSDLIDMSDKKTRYWTSSGSYTNNRLRAFNAYYNIVEDEETGDTEESWKVVNSYATMNNYVLPVSKFESK